MQELERRGLLDRKVESLPDDAALAERQKAGQPLTRPELGVLLAFAKIALKVDLLAGRVADDDALDDELLRYFPSKMAKAYAGGHRGPSAPRRDHRHDDRQRDDQSRRTDLCARGSASAPAPPPIAIARAYVTVRDAFGLEALNAGIDALDNKMPGMEQLELYRTVQDLLLTRTVWFLRNAAFDKGIAPVVAAYGATVAALGGMLGRVLPVRFREVIGQAAARFEAAGAPADSRRTDRDAAGACRRNRHPPRARRDRGAARRRSRRCSSTPPTSSASPGSPASRWRFRPGDYYDGLARDRALETLVAAHRRIATEVIAAGGIDAWMEKRRSDRGVCARDRRVGRRRRRDDAVAADGGGEPARRPDGRLKGYLRLFVGRRGDLGRRRRLVAEEGVDALRARVSKAASSSSCEHAAARQADAERIDRLVVDADLEVEMRAGRQAGRADIADHLALADARARHQPLGEGRLVAVDGLVAIGVA